MASDLEGPLGDSADLGLTVNASVDGDLAVVAALPRFAEIDSSCEFAHHDEIDEAAFTLERACTEQWSEGLGGPDIGEEVQLAAKREKSTHLRPQGDRLNLVPLGAANRSEQHGVRALAQFERFLGQRVSGGIVSGATDERFLEFEVGTRRLEGLYRFGGDFGTDSVPSDDGDSMGHSD